MDGLAQLVNINRIALESMQMRVEFWFLTRVFTWATAEQIAVIAAALGLAWLIAKPIRRRAHREAAQRSSWMEHSLRMLAFAAIRISFPLVALALLWGWVLLMEMIGSAEPLVRTAASLLTAWVVIRLLSTLIRNDTLARLVAAAAWFVAALNILDLLEPAMLVLDRASITLGQVRLSALGVLKAIVTLTIMLWVSNVLSRMFEQRLRSVPAIGASAQVLIGKAVKIGFLAVAVMVALNTVGIDLTTLAVLTGAIGVGIGFGLQKVVSNLVSGAILLLDRSIKPGDVIEIGNTFGWVQKLGARYVAVTTRDGMDWLIPNEDLITHRVVNWTFSDDTIRLRLPFQIAFESDIREAMTLAVEAAAEAARVLKQPAPVCRLMGFGDNGFDLELRLWIRDAQNGVVNVKSDVLLGVWDRFRVAGIHFPLPQRDIHIRSEAAIPALRATAEAASE